MPTLVTLHGLMRTSLSMNSAARYFKDQGYRVINPCYPTRKPMDVIVRDTIRPLLLPLFEEPEPVYFLTHSMGGIVMRYYAHCYGLPDTSRIVMLAPPNLGSHITDRFGHALWYRWALGKTAQGLGSDKHAIMAHLKPLTVPVGIIAGSRSADPLFNHCFDGPHDGKVAVANTQLPEMQDFLSVHATHTFLMRHKAVLAASHSFFEHGEFSRS